MNAKMSSTKETYHLMTASFEHVHSTRTLLANIHIKKMPKRIRTPKEMAKPSCAARLDLRDIAMMADFVFQGIPNLTRGRVFKEFVTACLQALQKTNSVQTCTTYEDARDRLEKVGIFMSAKEIDWEHVIEGLDKMEDPQTTDKVVSEVVADLDFEVENE